jgi:hypothetical protein
MVLAFLKRVVAAGLFPPVLLNRASVNKLKPTSAMVVDMTTRQQHLSNVAGESSLHVLRQNLNLAYSKRQRLHSEDDLHWKLDC